MSRDNLRHFFILMAVYMAFYTVWAMIEHKSYLGIHMRMFLVACSVSLAIYFDNRSKQ